jgi:hypothetical protein
MSRIAFFEIYDSLEIKNREERYIEAERIYSSKFGQNHFSDDRMFKAAIQMKKQEDDPFVGNVNQNPRTNK